MFKHNQRIESTLEAVRADIMLVREGLASLTSHMDMWKTTEASQTRAIEQIQRQVSSHSESDAGTHAELRADVRRLWWGVGIILTALAGTVIASLGVMR